MWFAIVFLGLLLIQAPKLGIWFFFAYLIYQYVFKQPTPVQASNKQRLGTGDLADLVLLRLELKNLADDAKIDAEQLTILQQYIDELCANYLAEVDVLPNNFLWHQRKEQAWQTLCKYTDTALGQPPWFVEKPSLEIRTAVIFESETSTIEEAAEPAVFKIDASEEEANVISHDNKIDVNEVLETKPAVFAIDESEHVPSIDTSNPEPVSLKQYTWQAHEPTRLERALSILSGWHALAIPFLVQNIGWFIGVFCFIAGSLFLVAYSSGYAKNLIAFLSFFIFTLALLFGGYQLRHKRPELITSSYVIFILSVLLIPITHITATQLLISSNGFGLTMLSTVLLLVELGVFYFAVQLVSGLINRSLQQQLPMFLLALTASQSLQLLLYGLPFWQMLAVIHTVIFAVLTLSCIRFVKHWLQALFVDKDNSAYFAVGTLLYAATVAFVFVGTHQVVTPQGYYGVFLMLLSGLLFFIDVQLKQWLEQHAYLSRFSFLVYGLSVLALCLAIPNQTASIITLILAIALYGFIVLSYLTLTPLSIFLACSFWLYSLLVLQHFAATWHFLLSLPMLLGLYLGALWALEKRQSASLALIIYRVLYALLALLLVWSLWGSTASWLALVTVITATVLIYYALKAAPQHLFSKAEETIHKQNLLHSNWFYLMPVLCAVAVFYAPALLNRPFQFALGMLLLSNFWSYQGLGAFFKANTSSPVLPIEQRLNSALLSLVISLLPIFVLSNPEVALLLLVAGGLLLWLSYQLLIRWLFCLLLLAWSIAFALLKLTYYPVPSNGIVTLLLGIAVWFWLWYSERQADIPLIQLRRDLMAQKLLLLPRCQLLGWYWLPNQRLLFREVIDQPLVTVLWLLWALSLKSIIVYLIAQPLSIAIIIALCLAALLSKLLMVRYQLAGFCFVPIGLGMAAIWFFCAQLAWSGESLLLLMAICSLLFWQLSVYQLAQPSVIRLINTLNPHFLSQDALLLRVIHHSFFVILLLSALIQIIVHTTDLTALLTMLTVTVFLWFSDRQYENLLVRYVLLLFSFFLVFYGVSLTLHTFDLFHFFADRYAKLLLSAFAIAISLITFKTERYAAPATRLAMLAAWTALIVQLIQFNAIVMPLDYGVLFLVSAALLIANLQRQESFCALSALFSLLLASLWLANALLHQGRAFSLWLSSDTFADLWLVLGILTGGFVWGSRLKLPKVYQDASAVMAVSGFIWTLLGTLCLFFTQRDEVLSVLFLLLWLIALPLADSKWRGFATASFWTLAVLNVLLLSFSANSLQQAIVIWAMLLWLVGDFALPRWNQRYSVTTPDSFLSLGWLLVAFSALCWRTLDMTEVGIYCLELSFYCLLMLRYHAVFAWGSAIVFTTAGVALNFDDRLPIALLLWVNLQLLLIRFWQRIQRWQLADLSTAFTMTSTVVLAAYLLLASFGFLATLFDSHLAHATKLWYFLPITILLSLSYWHLLRVRYSRIALHGFIYSLFIIAWTIYIFSLRLYFQAPLFLALWSWLLWLLRKPELLNAWLKISVLLATALLYLYSANDLPELLGTLTLLMCLTFIIGYRSTPIWLVLAGLEALLLLHGWWFLWLDSNSFLALMPWYALQLMIVRALLLAGLQHWLKPANEALYQQAQPCVSGLMNLSILELITHGVLLSIKGYSLFPPFDHIVALLTGLIVVVSSVKKLKATPDANAWYAVLLWCAALIYYARLVYLGNTAIGLWDTSLLIVCAYVLFFLQRFFVSKPLLNTALLMPILALCTVPLQLASFESSATLMVIGLLYTLMQHHSKRKIPLYLAVLAFNASVYLWIPSLNNHLLQVYVIPAALSVLLLLHLHKHEIKPSVLMNSRLCAISTIYACALSDVLARPELSIFILAIVLSMVGILLGIALKIRAFLYAGVLFLLLNVGTQLAHFYPEQTLAKAAVLMGLGLVILGAMIWFNLQRVVILSRLHAIQTEIKTWE